MTYSKTALITGVAGQDGAYLARFLLEKGYNVHGLVRWDSYADPLDGLARLDVLGLVDDRITLHAGDITDLGNISTLIKEIQPDEIYNLAALSQVHVSFQTPSSTMDINAKGTLNVLEAVKLLELQSRTRIYQASSSEMFGSSPAPQNEKTPFEPCSPYGVAKLAAYWMARTYRDAYGLYVSNGILFNHESPLRGEDFVTRKITKAVAEFEQGRSEPLRLGNLESLRDWGSSEDYVEGMWLMLQHDKPDDYVLATGEAHSVRDFVIRAFAHIGITLDWLGEGDREQALDRKTGKVVVEVDPSLYRPKEVNYLLGDAAKARFQLGWKPRTTFETLVSQMVNADRALLRSKTIPEISWPKMAG
ncbi:MAG: GDP-mannose 4,6-dehydratase [Alphaproteobacteria bacterium]|nr:GDP-mannose 4,6-dehydratase [Alphaproteobacteria bacterium]